MAKLLHKGGGKRGLISICTAGGMGVAAIVEGVEMHVLPKAEKPAEIAAGVV
jgi:acetyl-CoA C-acetyltransferase